MPEHAEPSQKPFSIVLTPRRGLNRHEASEYIGIGLRKFLEMVAAGRMPKPKRIDTRTVWDIQQLDRAFDALPQEGDGGSWEGV